MNVLDSNNIILQAKITIQELDAIRDNFLFVAELKPGENLQPTTTGRSFMRYATGYKDNPIQKTVDIGIGVYAYVSDAYSENSFRAVTTHYKGEILKAEGVFTRALDQYILLLEHKDGEDLRQGLMLAAKEAFICMSKSRIGFHNWQNTLAKKVTEETDLSLRIKKINRLIIKESLMLDKVFRRCISKFPTAVEHIEEKEISANNFNWKETFLRNCNVICGFAEGLKPLLQADCNLTLLEVYETKIVPAEWVRTWGEPQDELDRLIQAIGWTLDCQMRETERAAQVTSDEPALNNLVLLKDCMQLNLTLLDGLEGIEQDLLRRYGSENADLFQKLACTIDGFKMKMENAGDTFLEIVDLCRSMKLRGEVSFDLSESVCAPKSSAQFTTEEARKRLDAYVTCFEGQPSLEEARKLILEGQILLKNILTGDITSPEEYQEGAEQAITALTWFLMHIALKKGQGHEEGAFVIEDEGDLLYSFLMNAKAVGDRPSSHFIGRSPKWNGVAKVVMASSAHQGIDILNGLLPTHKRHILFGKVDSPQFLIGNSQPPVQVLFLKLESFSPYATTGYGYDFAMHGIELCAAQFNKKFKPGSDDLPEMAKERIPAQTLKQFGLIVDALTSLPQDVANALPLNEAKQMAKKWGVAYMHHFMRLVKQQGVELGDLDLMFEALDHLDRRTGREVYITSNELLTFAGN
ncbi:hypothetical protein [Estrella lausannensis]|uniref:Uncharacterized protein n=1 Tax=Estrella lausannensis TaxID=483423 RepID=A0A0H5DNE7_9BACT|nr:hypothetical protein [Estrella lausannensis]CRX37712.1 hypothetical protein ELAC_0351 [Estrella lausannensis]